MTLEAFIAVAREMQPFESMKTSGESLRHVTRLSSKGGVGPDVERWEIKASSQLRFTLRHVVLDDIQGRFTRWGGSLSLDRAVPTLSTVRVWIDLTSVDTGSKERDDHIRSAEFFDVARFSRAEFESSAIDFDRERVVLKGQLNLHGIARDVEIEVSPATAPVDAQLENVYRVRGTIDRRSFGLRWNQAVDNDGGADGDQVEVQADVDLARVDAG